MTEKNIHTDLSDAELQKLLDNYAEASLRSLESCVPPDLESRLDSTISRLAARSRMRRLMIRFSAAASIAVLLTVGIGYISHQQPLPSPSMTADSTDKNFMLTAESGLQEPGSVYATQQEVASQEENNTLISPAPASPIISNGNSEASPAKLPRKAASHNHIASSKCNEGNVAKSTETIPEQQIASIMPEKLPAVVASAELSPRLTLSLDVPATLAGTPSAIFNDRATAMTMNKVKESLEMVNAVFYEARKTASSLAEEVIYAAAAPMRSI